MATDEQKVWSSPEIGNYNIRPKADAKPERQEESRRRVINILGAANYDLLHSQRETNTTTDPIRDFKPYMADNSKSEVSYVAISGNKDTIAQTSHNRAFAKIGDTFDPLNDIKKAPESKKPGLNLSLGPVDIGSFKFGTDNAIAGEAAYLKKQKEKKQKNLKLKDPVVLHVEKDLMFINVLPDKDESGKMEQLLLNKRQYEAWKAGGTKGTRKAEVEAWLQTNTSPALKDELITAVPGYAPKLAQVVMNMESKVDEKRLQESRDAATQLKENIPPRVVRQNTKIEPASVDSSPLTPSPAPKLSSKPK